MSSSGPRKIKVVEEVLEVKEADASRIADINKCQKELDALKEAELAEIRQANKIINDKYNRLRKPYYEQRAAVVEGIPNFWGNVIVHHPQISKLVDEGEEECLRFLKKLEVEEFKSGFRLNFIFDENPFFDNRELSKQLQLGQNAEPMSSCTVIKWKENMELPKKQNDLKVGKVKKTFFSWFADTQDPTADDIVEAFKVDLWPNPLQYYKTGDENASLMTKEGEGLGASAALEEKATVGGSELSWDNLPSVILRQIVENLVRSVDRYEIKKSLLNLRLANTHWRNETDSCLEFERLKTWTGVEVEEDSYDNSSTSLQSIDCVPIYLNNTYEVGTNWVFCPAAVVELLRDGRNPFPAKSLTVLAEVVTSDEPNMQNITEDLLLKMRVGLMVMELDKLFQRSGNYLTSLFLIGLNLNPETLQGILEYSPHLKALSLNYVNIDSDSAPMLSPVALPALRHIRFIHSIEDEWSTVNVRLRKWILVSYQQQLETLKIDDVEKGMVLGTAKTDFTQLKRLTVWSVKAFKFLLKPEKFTTLTSLTLTTDKCHVSGCKYLLEDLRFHLAPFAGKLVELHLGLHFRSHITFTRENHGASGKVFEFQVKQYLNEFRWSAAGVIFSKLKTFSIRTSMVVEEEESVREMLRCVPNLEISNLILYPKNEQEQQQQLFRRVVEWEWDQCPKMRKIILWEDFEQVILTEHFKE